MGKRRRQEKILWSIPNRFFLSHSTVDKLTLHKKMKFSIKDFFSKCDKILNGKLHFLRSVSMNKKSDRMNYSLSKNQEQTDQIDKIYLKTFLIFWFITKPSFSVTSFVMNQNIRKGFKWLLSIWSVYSWFFDNEQFLTMTIRTIIFKEFDCLSH